MEWGSSGGGDVIASRVVKVKNEKNKQTIFHCGGGLL